MHLDSIKTFMLRLMQARSFWVSQIAENTKTIRIMVLKGFLMIVIALKLKEGPANTD